MSGLHSSKSASNNRADRAMDGYAFPSFARFLQQLARLGEEQDYGASTMGEAEAGLASSSGLPPAVDPRKQTAARGA